MSERQLPRNDGDSASAGRTTGMMSTLTAQAGMWLLMAIAAAYSMIGTLLSVAYQLPEDEQVVESVQNGPLHKWVILYWLVAAGVASLVLSRLAKSGSMRMRRGVAFLVGVPVLAFAVYLWVAEVMIDAVVD